MRVAISATQTFCVLIARIDPQMEALLRVTSGRLVKDCAIRCRVQVPS